MNKTKRILQLIALIDRKLNAALNSILHHPEFQTLEASWRGLESLLHSYNSTPCIKIKFFDASYTLFKKDLTRASDFDQTTLFTKIYNHEFNHAGGEPFGILIADYKITQVEILKIISQIAASSFTPFITTATPQMLGITSFNELEKITRFQNTWFTHFAKTETARFLSLSLPYVLMRQAYHAYTKDFCFDETITCENDHLWGSAIYAQAQTIIRSFINYGWFEDIYGAHKSMTDGGMLAISNEKFPATNIRITPTTEKKLNDLGLTVLTQAKFYAINIFYKIPTLMPNNPLHYVLSISRFAHYLKIIFRNKIGSFLTEESIQHFLNIWLKDYTAAGPDLSFETKAKSPLTQATVKVNTIRGETSKWLCTLKLIPHFVNDQIDTSLNLITELSI